MKNERISFINPHKTFSHKHAIFHKKGFIFIYGPQTFTQYWPKPLQTPVSPTVTIESLQKLQHVRVKVDFNVNSKRTNVRPAMIHYCAQVLYQLCCVTRSSVTAFLTCIFGLDSKNAPLWLGFLINCGTVRIRPGNVSYIRIHTHHPR